MDKPESLHRIIKKVNTVLKDRIEFNILEDKFPKIQKYILDDDIIVPEALKQYLSSKVNRELQTPQVLITNKLILGNLFFTHIKPFSITLCSYNDWELYVPPSLHSFLLYVGIRALIFYKYNALSHYETRGCILDLCKNKTDIKEFLRPKDEESTFCQSCKRDYPGLFQKIGKEIKILEKWVRIDFTKYEKEISGHCNLKRVAIHDSLMNTKYLEQIPFLDNCRIDLYPRRYVYDFLIKNNLENIEEVFSLIDVQKIQKRTEIFIEDKQNDLE